MLTNTSAIIPKGHIYTERGPVPYDTPVLRLAQAAEWCFRTVSTMYLPMTSDAVAAGDGALHTWTMPSV